MIDKLTNLTIKRKELGLSLETIAKKLKISRQHLHNIENGIGHNKAFETIYKISQILKCDPVELLPEKIKFSKFSKKAISFYQIAFYNWDSLINSRQLDRDFIMDKLFIPIKQKKKIDSLYRIGKLFATKLPKESKITILSRCKQDLNFKKNGYFLIYKDGEMIDAHIIYFKNIIHLNTKKGNFYLTSKEEIDYQIIGKIIFQI